MEQYNLPLAKLSSSRLVYGCMRICGVNSMSDRLKGKYALEAAFDAGYTHFDHADIYGQGQSELLFGEVLAHVPGIRDKLIITSKAGIRPKIDGQSAPTRYDFSQQHILSSVDESLKRLGVDYLDIFLLHRPDFLMNAEVVAETFALLKAAGKVRHFGVSNFSVAQVELLRAEMSMPLVTNQIEINIHNIESFTNGVLDQCQQHKITPMAWCPLGGVAYAAWGNTFDVEDEQRIKLELHNQAEKYQTQPWLIMLAWLLRHPAKILPIIGSTTPERIQLATDALAIDYQREDWYSLLEARNGKPVP